MIYEEDDIAFDNLTGYQFEEMCLDLLLRLGFHSPIWRQGGADSGRDIELKFSVINPLVQTYTEKWFIECKRHSSGIDVKEIYSKIAWADAEKPDHFVIITSSYITNNTRTWLDKISPDKTYKIHCIEGKELKKNILVFQDIVARYFGDECSKLLRVLKEAWQSKGLLPEPETLFLLYKNLDPRQLTNDDLVFLWCTYQVRECEIIKWYSNNSHRLFSKAEPFSFNYLIDYLWEKSDKGVQLMCQTEGFDSLCTPSIGTDNITVQRAKPRSIYIQVSDKKLGFIEVLMKGEKIFSSKIQRFDAKQVKKFRTSFLEKQ